MEITRRITIPYKDKLSYRVYLKDDSDRTVSLDTLSELSDNDAITKATDIINSSSDEPIIEENNIHLGSTLEETMESIIAAHQERGDILDYESCLEALDGSTSTLKIIKPIAIEPIEEIVR